jgi:uncharacterized protein YcbX
VSAQRVGTVAELWRYPVKSMAAESLTRADVSWGGLAGDRRWAFLRPDAQANGFPWQTIREEPAMSRYVARLTDRRRPDKSPITVDTPQGHSYDVADPALAAELGPGVRVMRLDRGAFDAMPVSLISTSSVSALCELAAVEPNALRFRPNFVIEPTEATPYAEDEWVGCVLQIGAAKVRIDKRDSRCVIVDVDPKIGKPDAKLLKLLGRHRDANAGVYATTVAPGQVRVGDPVTIIG